MVTVTFHQVCLTTLSLGLACGIAASSSNHWTAGQGLFDLGNDNKGNAIKALTIIGVAFMGFGLLLEILMMISSTFKSSRAVTILCLVCCIVSVGALLPDMIIYGSNYSSGGYSVWLLTACTVFSLEATFFYIVQWRFS